MSIMQFFPLLQIAFINLYKIWSKIKNCKFLMFNNVYLNYLNHLITNFIHQGLMLAIYNLTRSWSDFSREKSWSQLDFWYPFYKSLFSLIKPRSWSGPSASSLPYLYLSSHVLPTLPEMPFSKGSLSFFNLSAMLSYFIFSCSSHFRQIKQVFFPLSSNVTSAYI